MLLALHMRLNVQTTSDTDMTKFKFKFWLNFLNLNEFNYVKKNASLDAVYFGKSAYSIVRALKMRAEDEYGSLHHLTSLDSVPVAKKSDSLTPPSLVNHNL